MDWYTESWRSWTSLVAQWLRIHLPMQGTRVRSLVQEDPTCRGATKPVHHNYWACALEPACRNYWALMLQLLKPTHLEPVFHKRSHQWEAGTLQRRVAPTCRNYRKPACSNEDPKQPKKKKKKYQFSSKWFTDLIRSQQVLLCMSLCVCESQRERDRER